MKAAFVLILVVALAAVMLSEPAEPSRDLTFSLADPASIEELIALGPDAIVLGTVGDVVGEGSIDHGVASTFTPDTSDLPLPDFDIYYTDFEVMADTVLSGTLTAHQNFTLRVDGQDGEGYAAWPEDGAQYLFFLGHDVLGEDDTYDVAYGVQTMLRTDDTYIEWGDGTEIPWAENVEPTTFIADVVTALE